MSYFGSFQELISAWIDLVPKHLFTFEWFHCIILKLTIVCYSLEIDKCSTRYVEFFIQITLEIPWSAETGCKHLLIWLSAEQPQYYAVSGMESEAIPFDFMLLGQTQRKKG